MLSHLQDVGVNGHTVPLEAPKAMSKEGNINAADGVPVQLEFVLHTLWT